MKNWLTTLLVCLFPISGFAFNDLDKKLNQYYVTNKVTGNSAKADDFTWLRRVYLDLSGRIPTLKEINDFTKDSRPDKRNLVVDKILFSEDYVNNLYNFWADIFRVRPERLSDDVGLLKSYPYMDYIKTFIRNDIPYNKFVNELLTAKGRYTDNPATGYMLRDNGMPLDNLATTLQLFIGKDIACAQCHDDPFQDYTQKQFYQMAAFFTTLDNRESRKEYGDVLKRVDAEIKEITKKDRIDNNVRQLLASNLFNLKDTDTKTIKLPHDYKYPDAKPFDVVIPVSLDNKLKDIEKDKRVSIANWIITNPDFSNTVANRIWKIFSGRALVEPEVNYNISDFPEGVVLEYLGDYLEKENFSIRSLIRHIVTSDFYSRVAYKDSPENYKHQAIMVQRLSSYQLWDSILTFVIPDINYTRVSFASYSDLIEIDWTNVTGKGLLDRMENIREYEKSINNNFLKYKNIDLVRASFNMNKNNFVGQFLKEYGSSDRILIDTTNDKGSITQILVMMNSPLVELVTNKSSLIKGLSKDDLFLVFHARRPSLSEKDVVLKTEENDLIWALLNSREFLFKK